MSDNTFQGRNKKKNRILCLVSRFENTLLVFMLMLLCSMSTTICALTRVDASCENQFNLFHNGKKVLSGNSAFFPYPTHLNFTSGDMLVIEGGNMVSNAALFVEFVDLWQGIDYSTGVANWTCSIIGNGTEFGKPFSFPTKETLKLWTPGEIPSPYWYSAYQILYRPTTKWIYQRSDHEGSQRVLCGIVLDSNTMCNANNCSGQCSNGYYGSNCTQFECGGILPNNSTVCSSRGQCISPNNCSCSLGYYGSKCENYDCHGLNSNNTGVCSGHGKCTSPNVCQCSENYYQTDCSLKFDICSNSILCSNGSETIVEKVSSVQLNHKNITFSTSSNVFVLFPEISSYLETIDSSLKNESIKLVSSLSKDSTTWNNYQVISSIVTLKLFKDKTNEKLPVNNLASPITISFNHWNFTLPSNNTTELPNVTCQYYDETENVWKVDGVETSVIFASIPENPFMKRFTATCKTFHLTSFAIIDSTLKKELINNKPNTVSNADKSNMVIAAVVSSIAGVCVVGTTITLFVVIVWLFIRFKLKKKNSVLKASF